MTAAIIIVNYKTAGITIDCLRSLASDDWILKDGRVVVVDNDSKDDSYQQIGQAIEQNGWSGWASLMPAGRNGGFSFGNNQGIRQLLQLPTDMRPTYVLLLNPDTIVPPGAVGAMARFLDDHPMIGIVGSGTEDADGNLQFNAHRFYSPLGELIRGARLGILSKVLYRYVVSPMLPNEPTECDWVSGACFMIRRQVFESIGLLDEGYFLYFEEVEYCRRAKQGGWPVWFLPNILILHLEGQSTGGVDYRNRRAKCWFESRRRFFVTGYGVAGLVLADLLWTIGRMSFAVRQVFQRKQNPDPKYFVRDLLWGDLWAILSCNVFGINREGDRT